MCNPHGLFSCTLGNGCSTEHTRFYVGFCFTFRVFVPHSTTAPGGKPTTVHQRQPENDPDQPRGTERERWDHHTDRWGWWDRQSTLPTLYFRAFECVFPFLLSYNKTPLYFCGFWQFLGPFPVSLWELLHSKTESCFTGKNLLNPTESSYSMRYPKLCVDSKVSPCLWETHANQSARHRSVTVACAPLTLRCLSSGQGSRRPCPPTPATTSFLSSTQASRISSRSVRPRPKDSAPPPHWTWPLIFQVGCDPPFPILKISTIGEAWSLKLDLWSCSSSNNWRVRWIGGFSQRNCHNHHRSAQTSAGKRGTDQVV